MSCACVPQTIQHVRCRGGRSHLSQRLLQRPRVPRIVPGNRMCAWAQDGPHRRRAVLAHLSNPAAVVRQMKRMGSWSESLCEPWNLASGIREQQRGARVRGRYKGTLKGEGSTDDDVSLRESEQQQQELGRGGSKAEFRHHFQVFCKATRSSLRGGISKSILQRPCQFLAINAHKMAPRTT